MPFQLRRGTQRTLCSIITFDNTHNSVVCLPIFPSSYFAPCCIHHSFQSITSFDKSRHMDHIYNPVQAELPWWFYTIIAVAWHRAQGSWSHGRGTLADILEDTPLPASTKACYESSGHGGFSALVISCMINGHHWKWVDKTKYSGSDHLTWQSHWSCSCYWN